MKPRASDKLWSNPAWAAANWGKRRGKPWTDDELVTAYELRQQGRSVSVIADELGRTVQSVNGKIGYQRGAQ